MANHANEDQSQRAAWYCLGVLTFAFIVSLVDRTIMTMMVDPIRSDLAISDTAFSLLHGPAFAFFYVFLARKSQRMRCIGALYLR